MNDFIDTVADGLEPLGIRPIIYTNKSWWETRLAPDVRFDTKVWLSDYRRASHQTQTPNLISGHAYNLWQFTDRGRILMDGVSYGPFDCNKLALGTLDELMIR